MYWRCTVTLSWSVVHTSHLSYEYKCGPSSLVGIATELRARWSGIESPWERDFPPVQNGPGAHLAFCTMGTGSFPEIKCGRGVLLTTHPLLVPRSRPVTGLLYFFFIWIQINLFFGGCRSLNLRGSRNLSKISTGHLSRPQFQLSLLGSLAS